MKRIPRTLLSLLIVGGLAGAAGAQVEAQPRRANPPATPAPEGVGRDPDAPRPVDPEKRNLPPTTAYPGGGSNYRPAPGYPTAPGGMPGQVDVMRNYVDMVDRYTRMASDPAMAGVAAAVTAGDLLRQKDGPDAAIRYFNDELGRVRNECVRRAIRLQLAEFHKMAGHRDEALDQLRKIMEEAPEDGGRAARASMRPAPDAPRGIIDTPRTPGSGRSPMARPAQPREGMPPAPVPAPGAAPAPYPAPRLERTPGGPAPQPPGGAEIPSAAPPRAIIADDPAPQQR